MSAVPKRYTALDGLRGVAAVSVVGWHEKLFLGAWYAHSAYLAVDLFFCLSGFVIAVAYGGRLAGGMSWGAFMRIRMVRLYPLYLAGTLMAVAALVVLAGAAVRDGALDKINEFLGFISYPLYATHASAIMIFAGGIRRFAKSTLPVPLTGWLLMASLILIGTVAGVADEAVRRRLRGMAIAPSGPVRQDRG